MKSALLIILALAVLIFNTGHAGAAQWKGIDETVVEKIAEERGHAPADPIINTDVGDLLLFVFLVFGVGAGFMAGYNYRRLIEKRHSKVHDDGGLDA